MLRMNLWIPLKETTGDVFVLVIRTHPLLRTSKKKFTSASGIPLRAKHSSSKSLKHLTGQLRSSQQFGRSCIGQIHANCVPNKARQAKHVHKSVLGGGVLVEAVFVRFLSLKDPRPRQFLARYVLPVLMAVINMLTQAGSERFVSKCPASKSLVRTSASKLPLAEFGWSTF